MTARLILSLTLLGLLAGCGACEGHVNNSGSSRGRCAVLTMPW